MRHLHSIEAEIQGKAPGEWESLTVQIVDCVAARLTLEHVLSLLRSLGFASHPLGWFAFFTLSKTISAVRRKP
ncbi:MAG: hypothetical protein NTAFB01_31010 [Nitrospira sp.]